MPFLGRVREMRIAERIIDSRGVSACLFVGEPGIGKTALLREIARRHDTVAVSTSSNERMWPLSGLSAVAAGLGDARGAAIDAVLARGRDWPEHLLADELRRMLLMVVDEPELLVVDDLDEMDSASITVLSYVFGRLRGTGLSVVASVGALDARHDFAGMAHERVDRLDFDEAVEVARALLGPMAAPAVLHIVAEETDGDPGILTRVRLTAPEAAGDEPLPVPLRLADDTGRRRRSVPEVVDPRAGTVLDLLSVGPVYGFEPLRATAMELNVDIDGLIDAGLVAMRGELARIADPALRLRRHAALGVDERRRLHERAADDHAAQFPATYQWHRSFLDPAGDRCELLVAAADLAGQGEPLAAVEFAERALAGHVGDAERGRLLVELGEALVLQCQPVLGRHYLRRAGVLDEPVMRARAALGNLRAIAAVAHAVDDTVLHEQDDVDPRSLERLLAENGRQHLRRADLSRTMDAVSLAIERGAAGRETALLARLVEEFGVDPVLPLTIDVGVGDTASGCSTSIEEGVMIVALALLREEYAEVRHRVRSMLDCAPRPAPIWRDYLLWLLLAAEVRAGDPVAAREAMAAWQHERVPGRTPDASTMMLFAGAAALDPLDGRAADLVRRGRDLCRREGTPTLLPWFATIDGGLALAEGRYDDAITALQAARDAAAFNDPSLLRIDADLVEALWLSGRRAEARRELARFEKAAERYPRRWTTLALARARAVCRSGADGEAAFREAKAVTRTDDAPAEHRRLAASRERCLPTVERTPARIPARKAPRGRALTPQEQEVVALVGQGLRNREVAAELYISLRTVELRLTGIYRKLGIASRVHLVALLHGSPTS